MSKHTPGPWSVDQGLTYKGCVVADIGCGCGRLHTIASTKDFCAILDGSGKGNDCSPDRLPAESNARLIAASPELLEALKEARIEIGAFLSSGAGPRTKRAFEMIDAAIAKAEGK